MRDNYRTRRAVHRAKHRILPKFSDEPRENAEEYITRKIARADHLIKERKYADAYSSLDEAYLSEDYGELREKDRYDTAFIKRLSRIIKHSDKDTRDAAQDLREHIGKKHKKSGLEKSLGTLSIIGLLGGLFFLMPNVTGKVIYNSTSVNYNIISACLFVIGLIGAFFYFLNER